MNATGTPGADTIHGSDMVDSMDGMEGDDTLYGYAGNDVLSGGAGADKLFGGADNDRLSGGDGNDQLWGEDGNDQLEGGAGDDVLVGAAGDDVLDGGTGNDTLYGDDLYGTGNNILRGGEGNDALSANSTGNNVLEGGEGDDSLGAGQGNDRMSGGAGNDWLMLVSTSDKAHTVFMAGDEGNDLLHISHVLGTVKVFASGGEGADTFRIGAFADLTITDFSTGDRLDLRPLLAGQTTSGNPFGALGFLKAAQDGARVLVYVDSDGAAGKNSEFKLAAILDNTSLASLSSASFVGGFDPSGSEQGLDLRGTAGADVLLGGLIDDVLEGGAGDDKLAGSKGNDRLYGGDGDDQLEGDSAGFEPSPDGEDPQVYLPGGNDLLDGGAGKDRLTSSWGADTLLGGAGDDVLSVTSAPSSLPASAYQVTLDGGDGNDRLTVSSGVNANVTVSMTGGAGSDTFELSLNSRLQGPARIITDFQAGAGGDVLDMFESMGFVRQSPFASGHFLLEQRGADTVVRYDPSGPDFSGPVFDVVTLKNTVKETLTADNMRYGYAPDGTPVVLAPEQRGSDGRDRLEGDAQSNALYGGDGNDVLVGHGGNDYLNGGSGIDTAVFRGNASQYLIAPSNPQDFVVSDRRGGATDGKDRLVGVERLFFDDKAIAIGVGDNGGTAFEAYRLYRAAFDREPDQVGLGFWIEMLDRGVSLHAVADGFTRSPEFVALYGSKPSNAEIVTRLYRNILDREPEQGGYEFWLSILDNKKADLGTVLAAFSESQENQDAVWALVGNAVFYQPYVG